MFRSFYPDEASQAVTALNFDLENVVNYSNIHFLKLNFDKSVAVIFGNKVGRQRFIDQYSEQIVIQEHNIKFNSVVKNLGLYIDNDLRFTTHINKCVQTAYCNLKSIYQNRQILNRNVKSMLCDSLVLSHFNYCDGVYGPCLTNLDAQRIQRVQKFLSKTNFWHKKTRPYQSQN